MTNISDQYMAHITKTSLYTGKVRTLRIPQYEDIDFERRYLMWRRGEFTIEEVFPDLSRMALEFIRTGATKEELEELEPFGDGKT